MRNFTKSVFFFFFFTSLAMAQWDPRVLNDPQLLFRMSSEEKSLLVEDLKNPAFVFNIKVQDFIFKALFEYWKAEREGFEYDGLQVRNRIKGIYDNQYTELGYLIQYIIYIEEDYRGTVYDAVLRSMPERVEEIIKSKDLNTFILRRYIPEEGLWSIKLVSKELVLRGYAEMMEHMLGTRKSLDDVVLTKSEIEKKIFIKNSEAEYEYLMNNLEQEAQKSREYDYIRSFRQYAFSDSKLIPLYIDDLSLLDALLQKILLDINSKDVQTRNMAISILLSEELDLFMSDVERASYYHEILEVFSLMKSAIEDYRVYVKSPVNIGTAIYPQSKQILLKEAIKSISLYKSYRIR